MPPATAVRIADAALEVLGTGGIHALSHARVDATAGLPAGSTSNYFRTRAALVAGAIARLEQFDEEQWQATVAAGRPSSPAGLADAFAAFVESAAGAQRTMTVARYVISVQGVVEPALLETLNANRRRVADWAAAVLTDLGVPDARDTASALLAGAEGLILHRLTGFAAIPAGPHLLRLIGADR
ncbi:TetR/AcrR family transcriptional regulator [Actinoplanes sp. NPDC024001]|uniref:TetR/AcrR family transcriptional regulator n=1 Tax=Actinoplanes sp. NPDC024001 TaxID=3154598 RepID=UPI003409FB46